MVVSTMAWHWNGFNYSVEIAETWQHMKDSLVWCYPMKASPDSVTQALGLDQMLSPVFQAC